MDYYSNGYIIPSLGYLCLRSVFSSISAFRYIESGNGTLMTIDNPRNLIHEYRGNMDIYKTIVIKEVS